eukprot:GHVL01022739.1.p1 GENE.GHVL01022739.1~~GHVL01022739.1.p1  ORF type:complete len:348 (+),score=59.48 GHVL01022739.1:1029-2072(+)
MFTGSVKLLTSEVTKFSPGSVRGYIQCSEKSSGVKETEDGGGYIERPEQKVTGSASIEYLDLNEQHLVVRIIKAEKLAIGNLEKGTSNPKVKVKWDGIVQWSGPRSGTCNPVWNEFFYFPVRLISDKLRTNMFLVQNMLPEAMKVRGPIDIEVWHEDDIPEYLGGLQINLSEITSVKTVEKRRLLMETKEIQLNASMSEKKKQEKRQENESGSEDDELPQKEETFEEHEVRVYEADKKPLNGSSIQSLSQSCLSCECYFIPDFNMALQIPDPPTKINNSNMFSSWRRKWDEDFAQFSREYLKTYPDGPQNRYWDTVTESPINGQLHPLPCYISSIVAPEELLSPVST